MVMGIFLEADNKLLDKCQQILEEKIDEVCGGNGGTCEAPFANFAGGGFMGAVDWTAIGYSDDGELKIDEYLKGHGGGDNVRNERESAQGKIDAVITLIEKDEKIAWCIGGRNMSQIGVAASNAPRFPNLTRPVRRVIAAAGLRTFGK